MNNLPESARKAPRGLPLVRVVLGIALAPLAAMAAKVVVTAYTSGAGLTGVALAVPAVASFALGLICLLYACLFNAAPAGCIYRHHITCGLNGNGSD